MGLYEAELSKQIHLRNKQQKEWETMKKKMGAEKTVSTAREQHLKDDKLEDDRIELEETNKSKSLASSLLKGALARANDEEEDVDVLQKAVDVILNQNGKVHNAAYA